ncbi:MAG: hypothetical protein HY848_08805 [Betaproteobacteria bacterium]|nr:hypothetical protein [Betaproteobacteria bacterium]
MSDKPIQSHSSSTALTNAAHSALKADALRNALYSAFKGSALGEEQVLGMPSALHAAAFSEDTRLIERRVNELLNPPSPASLTFVLAERQLEERLFDATASVKILTAQIAMHLEREWRDKLFRQLDSLHDLAEWEPDDEPIQQASFATFLKAIVEIKPQRRPGLGLSHGGNLIAAWTTGRDRLTIEFMAKDRVRWVLARYRDGESEYFAGQTSVSRLAEGLAPYDPKYWFSV